MPGNAGENLVQRAGMYNKPESGTVNAAAAKTNQEINYAKGVGTAPKPAKEMVDGKEVQGYKLLDGSGKQTLFVGDQKYHKNNSGEWTSATRSVGELPTASGKKELEQGKTGQPATDARKAAEVKQPDADAQPGKQGKAAKVEQTGKEEKADKVEKPGKKEKAGNAEQPGKKDPEAKEPETKKAGKKGAEPEVKKEGDTGAKSEKEDSEGKKTKTKKTGAKADGTGEGQSEDGNKPKNSQKKQGETKEKKKGNSEENGNSPEKPGENKDKDKKSGKPEEQANSPKPGESKDKDKKSGKPDAQGNNQEKPGENKAKGENGQGPGKPVDSNAPHSGPGQNPSNSSNSPEATRERTGKKNKPEESHENRNGSQNNNGSGDANANANNSGHPNEQRGVQPPHPPHPPGTQEGEGDKKKQGANSGSPEANNATLNPPGSPHSQLQNTRERPRTHTDSTTSQTPGEAPKQLKPKEGVTPTAAELINSVGTIPNVVQPPGPPRRDTETGLRRVVEGGGTPIPGAPNIQVGDHPPLNVGPTDPTRIIANQQIGRPQGGGGIEVLKTLTHGVNPEPTQLVVGTIPNTGRAEPGHPLPTHGGIPDTPILHHPGPTIVDTPPLRLQPSGDGGPGLPPPLHLPPQVELPIHTGPRPPVAWQPVDNHEPGRTPRDFRDDGTGRPPRDNPDRVIPPGEHPELVFGPPRDVRPPRDFQDDERRGPPIVTRERRDPGEPPIARREVGDPPITRREEVGPQLTRREEVGPPFSRREVGDPPIVRREDVGGRPENAPPVNPRERRPENDPLPWNPGERRPPEPQQNPDRREGPPLPGPELRRIEGDRPQLVQLGPERGLEVPPNRVHVSPPQDRENPQGRVEPSQRINRESSPERDFVNYPKYGGGSLFVAGDQTFNRELPPFWQTRGSGLSRESTGDIISSVNQRSEFLKYADSMQSAGGLKNDPVIKEIMYGVRGGKGEFVPGKEGDPSTFVKGRNGEFIASAGTRGPDGIRFGDPSSWTGLKSDIGKGPDGTSSGVKFDPHNHDGAGYGPRGPHTGIAGIKDSDGIPGKRGEASPIIADDWTGKDGKIVHGTKGTNVTDSGAFIPDAGLATIFTVISDKGDSKETDKSTENNNTQEERERRQRYIVKKGDTLESIALKVLKNVKLNVLLFEINRNIIPTKFENGNVILHLRPKLVIWLPTKTEIKKFCQRAGSGSFRKFEYVVDKPDADEKIAIDGVKTLDETNTIPQRPEAIGQFLDHIQSTVQDTTPHLEQPATISENPFLVPVSLAIHETQAKPSRLVEVTPSQLSTPAVTQPQTTVQDLNSSSQPAQPVVLSPASPAGSAGAVYDLGENRRYIKLIAGDLTYFRLEVCQGEYWLPVISYETSEILSVRHEYLSDGRKKTIRIDLPLFAVHQLAENDLLSNWAEYCRGYEALDAAIEVFS